MAFEVFGLKWVSQGAATMARDLAHIAMGMSQFIGVSQKFEKQVLAAAQAQVRAAAQQVSAADRAQRALVNSANRQAERIEVLRQRIFALIAALYQQGISEARIAQLREKILQVDAKLYQAEQAQERITDELIHSGQESAKATENYVDKQKQLVEITNESKEEMSGLSGAMNILLSKIFPATNATMQFAQQMGLSIPVGRALVLVLDVLAAGLNILRLALSAVIGVLGLVYNAVTKIISVFFQATVAVGKFVLDAIWKLITLPFRLAWQGLGAIADSLMRIAEIAIGMNLSNLIWNITQRIRELIKVVINAGVNFQVLQIRMRGLIQREMSENEGISFSKSLETATERAKELSVWTSNLALQTKFNAQDIADIFTLAMSYDFTTAKSKELTLATVQFATGMGLGNNEIRRIIENFGQMRAQGKITGTELRDLARGAFLPVNEILRQMAVDLKIDTTGMTDVKTEMQKLVTEGGAPLDAFFDAFIHVANRDFPNAIENMQSTMEVFTSNVQDFFESILGWRIVTPVLNEISGHLVAMLDPFLSPEFRRAATFVGEAISGIVKSLFGGFNTTTFALQIKTVSVGIGNVLESIIKLSKVNLKNLLPGPNFVQQMAIKDLSRDLRNLFSVFAPTAIGSTDRLSNLIAQILGNFQKGDFLTGLKESMPQFKEIGDMLWNDVISPAFASAWANIKTTVAGWWTNSIQPALQDLWNNYLVPELTKFWNTTLPDFWKNTGRPEFIKMLNNLGIWVDENQDLGKQIGSGLMTKITEWLQTNAGPASEFAQTVGSLIGSVFSIALAQGLNLLTGAIATNVGEGKTEEPTATQLPDTFNKATEKAGGLSGAIQRLSNVTREALDGSLTDFKNWVFETTPGLDGLSKKIDAISLTINSIGRVIWSIMEPFKRWSEILGGEKGGGGGKQGLDVILGIVNGALSVLDLTIRVIMFPIMNAANQFERFKKIFTGDTGGKPLGYAILDAIVAPFGDIKREVESFTGFWIEKFNNLYNDLVGQSIIPDMMNDMFTIISTKLVEIASLFDPTNGNSLPSKMVSYLSGVDLYSIGAAIATTLYNGIQSMAGTILSLWAKLTHATVSISGVAGGAAGAIDTAINNEIRPVSGAFQNGADFIVPPGFENDSFRMRVGSGERVIVIPKYELARMMTGWNSPKSTIYGGSGNTYQSSNTRQYNLNVSTTKSMSAVSSEFSIMRLVGE